MKILLSETFERAYRELPENIQNKVDKALALLDINPRYPSLHIEKIDVQREIWSGRVDRNYRFTFQWIPGGIILRKVGTHQDAYRSP